MKKLTKQVSEVSQRRKVLKGIVAGGGIAGTTAVSTWTRPVIDSVVLPAHATLSALSRFTFIGSGPPITMTNQGGSQLYAGLKSKSWLDTIIPAAHADDSLGLWQYLLIEVTPGNFKMKVLAEGVSETCLISFLFTFNGLTIGGGPVHSVVRACFEEERFRDGPTARLLSIVLPYAYIMLDGFPVTLLFDSNPADLNITECPDCFEEV